MKKFIIALTGVLFLLFSLAASAQTTADQTKTKINKKNLVINEWITNPKGGNKTLDHVTIYSPEGKKIEETEYNADGQKWRKRYEFGVNDKVSRELVYDGKNRLQTYKTFEYNEFGRKKVQYTYDAKGKLISIKHFEYLAQNND